jgi:tRNA pseudouridine38-40 synthase
MRYRAIVEYDGTEFCGWQLQPNGPTLQAAIEDALLRLAGQPVRVFASGRTDSGVHALGQVISFNLEREIGLRKLHRALNALTPESITIRSVDIAAADFDPRRMARRRAYVYRIWNDPYPSPFWRRFAWHVARPLDMDAMQRAANDLLGEHDFEALRAASCDSASSIRLVYLSEWKRDGQLLSYHIEASSFLRHMVRTIVGELVEIGLGVRAVDDIPRLLATGDRIQAAATAPPLGLSLTRVDY